MKRLDPGTSVKISTKEETYEGIVMPSQKSSIVVLKLKSGYNVGIKVKKIKKVEEVKGKKKAKAKSKPVKQNTNLPKVIVLHTGGTIASRVDYETGAVIAKFKPEDLLEQLPELQKIAQVDSKLVLNIQSESMRFGHYNLLAKEVVKAAKDKPKGVIITHGTDTLHYTSAALSFMLKGLDVPVLLVGAQRSSDRGSSDAAPNLISAIQFLANSDWKGVGICMHKTSEDTGSFVLQGTKARKMHSTRRDAFRPINLGPVADISYPDGKITMSGESVEVGKVDIKLFKENIKVGILKSHTNMFPEDFSQYKDHKGLVIEGTGLGHTQTMAFDKLSETNKKNYDALKKVIDNGCVVVLTTQCIYGSVNMNVYSPQRELTKIGVIGAEDMTTESAFIKLAWLLSNYSAKETKELITKNMCGEINERHQYEESFLR